MAWARKGFQGFIDPNGNNIDFFKTLESMKKATNKSKQGTSGTSGESGYIGVTGMTGTSPKIFADTKYTPPVEQPKQKNKVVFNIEKIS